MKELQPNYLNDQLNAAASDITKAADDKEAIAVNKITDLTQ